MEKLKKLRDEIDDIDKQIVELIEKRMKASVKVGELKKENNIPVFDAEREKELIEEKIKLLKKIKVKGISHITGGGFYENIPRCIPNGLCAEIEKNKIKILPIFKYIQKIGNIEERDMFNTFNMGVGMCIIVSKKDAEKTIEILSSCKEDAYIIGKIIENKEKIIFKE